MSLEGKRGGVYKPEYWGFFSINTFEVTNSFLFICSLMHAPCWVLLSVGTLMDFRGDDGVSFVSLPNLQVHFKRWVVK